jgi:integrase
VAERKAVEYRDAFKDGRFDPWAENDGLEPLTLHDAIQAFLDTKRGTVSDRTLGTYEGILERWVKRAPVGIMLVDVAPQHIKPYIYQATKKRGGKPVSQATRHKRYRHLKTFLRWCVKAGHLSANPLDDVPQPDKDKSLPSYLTPRELDRLLEYIEWHGENVTNGLGIKPDVGWLRHSIIIAVSTGLRRGELLALRWQDVDLERGIIHVKNRGAFRTKNGAERTVPVRGRALGTLERIASERDNFHGHVILDRDGSRPKPNRLSRYFKDMVRAAKLKDREGLRFHSLRHSCGAWLASQGVSERIIQEILGHASSATTQIYSHVAGSAVEDAMERTFGSTS